MNKFIILSIFLALTIAFIRGTHSQTEATQTELDTCPAGPSQQITAQDQRAYISISVKIGTPCEQVQERLARALGRHAYHRNHIARLYREFKDGTRTNTDRVKGSGRKRTATDQEHEDMIKELMSESRTWTSYELSDQTGISQNSVLRILARLNYRKIGPKYLPHKLTCEQKRNRVRIARRNVALYNQDPERFIERIITMDETWMRCYDPLDPQQAREWRQPGEEPPINVREELRDWKVLMTAVIHNDTIAGWDFLETDETMNGERFLTFLKNVVAPIIQRKRIRRPLILMDNARPHATTAVRDYIRRMGWEILEHPAWSPDLSPCDYDLFNRIKRPLRGRRFEDRDLLIDETEKVMNDLNRESRLVGMANLPNRWKEVITKKGEYLLH